MLWTDTLDILLDYGFDTYAKRRVRLLGYARERQDKFKEATAFTRECVEHKDIYVQTYKVMCSVGILRMCGTRTDNVV